MTPKKYISIPVPGWKKEELAKKAKAAGAPLAEYIRARILRDK